MESDLRQALDDIKERLDSHEGILDDYRTLLSNHMTDYSTKFGRLKASLDASIENGKVTAKALETKIDSYKWGLILVASFTVISLTGFVALSVWAIIKLIGG